MQDKKIEILEIKRCFRKPLRFNMKSEIRAVIR